MRGIQCTNSRSLSWLNQRFWCLSYPWICHSCLKILWCVRQARRIKPWAPCLLPLGRYTCQALPVSEAQAKVKATMAFLACECSPQLSPKKLGPYFSSG